MTSRADQADPLLIDEPAAGRVHRHARRVQLGDGSPKGRMRLDAVARFLQDVSDEDTTSSGMDVAEPWVVRRVALEVSQFPVFREQVELSTWCSGIGGRWAERRVRMVGDRGGRIDAAVLWVHLDRDGRPAKLDASFLDTYASAAAGRTVRARLHHGSPSDHDEAIVASSEFPLRFCDHDMMGHVNNAISWVAVEEVLAGRPDLGGPLRAATEHPAPILPGTTAELHVVDHDDGFASWLVVDGSVASASELRIAARPPEG